MKECPRCKNLAADNASSCGQCGMVLDQSVIARAARPRIPTITESAMPSMQTAAPQPEYRPTPASTSMSFVTTSTPASAPAKPATQGNRRGQTVYMPVPATTNAGPPAPQARRVLAVLVTYSWKPEGQIFPIREGRNLIGRGEECDVRVPEDQSLSGNNTHITFRQNFTIGDLVSMSGTDIDGVPIEEQFRPLHNLSRIRAGSTQFLFVVVDPVLLAKTAE